MRLPLLLLPALACGCAPSAPPGPPQILDLPDLECGLPTAAVGKTLGQAIRSCALPTASEIEATCENWEAKPIPASSDPEHPGSPLYSRPDYSVTGLHCVWPDESHSQADCRFDIAKTGDDGVPRTVRTRLAYRYFAFGDELVFGYGARWAVSAACTAG